MAQINPKLNLNKTPSLIDNNSLIFAKNIRLDIDGTIHRDYGTRPLSLVESKTGITDYNNLLNRIIKDLPKYVDNNGLLLPHKVTTDLRNLIGSYQHVTNNTYKIVGIIPNTDEFYVFIHGSYDNLLGTVICNYIIRYNELTDKFNYCDCNWTYSGGTITGQVINNLLGEKILVIGETGGNKLVPLKCINLSKSKMTDDESIYTQTPNIPITNLNHVSYFSYSIPLGVYQFFVRYEIRKNVYTNWFPASKELFIGNETIENTSFGTVKYMNTHKSSNKSFVFEVEHLFNDYNKNYKGFQIGFIASSENQIIARAWKTFDFNKDHINFDFKNEDSIEIDVTDLTNINYQIYDVGNITSFKNKLYIANYKETDFNDKSLQDYANNVSIFIESKDTNSSLGEYNVITEEINGRTYISGFEINNTNHSFSGQNGIINELFDIKNSGYNYTVRELITDSFTNNSINASEGGGVKYDIDVYITSRFTLEEAKNSKREELLNSNGAESYYSNIIFNNNIDSIKVNNEIINGTTLDALITYLNNLNIYLNENKVYEGFIDENGKSLRTINISIVRKFTYDYSYTTGDIDEESGEENWEYEHGNLGEYEQTFVLNYETSKLQYNKVSVNDVSNYSTLIPYQKYKFFIHFIKQNGEITNGYYCGGENAGIIEVSYKENADNILYPIFTCPTIPEGYVSYFYSILHVKTFTSTVFNINPNATNTDSESNCLDINLGLFNSIENITIKQDENTITNGKYHYSGDSSVFRYFGSNGVLTWDAGENIVSDKLAYAINDYVIPENTDIELIKCTPFINPNDLTNGVFDNYSNLNLLGFICNVYVLDRGRTIDYYANSGNVYKKVLANGHSSNYHLTELSNHIKDENNNLIPNVTNINLIPSSKFTIYSNYNLNYLVLTEDIKENYKTVYPDSVGTKNSEYIIVLKLFESLIMSNIYTFPSMYKTYTRKTYSKYKDNEITKFDNTIRSSELEGDENSIHIFKFNAEDYYNVPTNRGIITNLVAVGDSVLVHTKDSLFRFSGSNSLQSSSGEILTNESKIFDTGIAEVFGSDFGFAGLQSKTDHIITENGYIFFDRDSRIVYIYSGNGQISKISDSIEKLFRYKDIKNIYFANDYYNNRFFMSIIFTEDNIEYPVTLSFSHADNIKSFVSLHDFYFYKAFNTKTKCYFFSHDFLDICTVDKNNKGRYFKLGFEDKIYPQDLIYENIKIYNNDAGINSNYELINYNSIVDVIENNNFETIKTLNAVNFCANIVESEFKNIDKDDYTTLKMAEDIVIKIPCKAMRIYTDTCMSPLNDFTKTANDYKIANPNNYKYPFYNQGLWTFNYFRNIQNSNNNIYSYVSDQNSLIEGKYFVIRFIFDKDFKLETLNLNYNIKHG